MHYIFLHSANGLRVEGVHVQCGAPLNIVKCFPINGATALSAKCFSAKRRGTLKLVSKRGARYLTGEERVSCLGRVFKLKFCSLTQ
jgi:hypothetical protein